MIINKNKSIMRKLFVIAIIALIAMTVGAQKKISKERIHVSKAVPAPPMQAMSSTTHKNNLVTRSVAKMSNQSLTLIDVSYGFADDSDNTEITTTSTVQLDLLGTTTSYNGKEMSVGTIYLGNTQWSAYWDEEQLVIPVLQTYYHSQYGEFLMLGISTDGNLCEDTDIIYTLNPGTGKYDCNMSGWYIYMTSGDYAGSAWSFNSNSTMLIPNGTETGIFSRGEWLQYTYPIYIEDNTDEINIYNFYGCSKLTILVDQVTGELLIPMHQPIYPLNGSIDNYTYGFWYRLIGFNVNDENRLIADESIEYKTAYFARINEENSLEKSEYNIITDPSNNGYMGIFSNFDEEGLGYYMGYIHSINFTLNEGTYKFFGTSDDQFATYVERAITKLQTQCGTLEGFDALATQVQTAISAISTEVNDMEAFEAFKASVAEVEDLLRQAADVKEKYNALSELVKSSKELYAVTANAALGTAIAQAEEVIASKAALTIESAGTIAAANKVLSEVLEGIGLNSTKVWDFVISQETIDALNYDSNYYGKWSNNGTYFRNYSSSNDWEQLTYYNQSGQLENVKETEGLYFYQGGYNWYIYVDGTNRIRSNGKGSSYAFMIPDVKAGQEIIIDYKSASEGSVRGISMYSNNLKVIGGYETSADYGVVSYEVTSDGDALFYPLNGGIYINNITLTIAGDPMRLVELRRTVADYLATLDAFPGLQAELQEAYDNAVATEEGADIAAIISNLRNVYDNIQKAVEAYPVIVADLETANAILTEGAYVGISEAVTLGAALDVNTSKSAEYLAAFEALETALAIYKADNVAMENWTFDTGYIINVDGLRYALDYVNNLAEFVGFDKNNALSGNLNIPATIRYEGLTFSVVAVENIYQYTQNNINSVTLPKSLRKIGDYAFYYYGNLRYLEIPANVTVMGNNVFYGANNLHALKVNAVVPPTVGSFNGSSQKKVTIPAESFHAYRMASNWNSYILIGGDGVTVSTGKIAAGDLGHVILDEAGYLQEVNKLIVDEGTLNNDDWSTIKSMNNLIEIDLSGVTASNIPSSLFSSRWAIEKVVLPHNTATIGNSAFQGTSLKEITFPETLTTIESYAFSNCDSLRTVSIPSSVNQIPYSCFNSCDNLQKVEIAEGLSIIDSYAFESCTALNEVNLPATLTTIGEYAFRNVPLKKIEIPAGIAEIKYATFTGNNAIDSLVIPSTVKTINNYAFENCTSLKSLQLNEGLVNIYGSAFSNCKQLTEVILPSSLEKCENAPFYGCTGIKKIEARSVIPPTTNGYCPINNVDLTDVVLYVPSWSTSEYPLAEGWSSFYTYETTDFLPEYIKVNKDFYFTLRDDVTPDYRPNIYMTYSNVQSEDAYGRTNYERGNLTVSGRSKLAVNNFDYVVSPFAKYYADENVYYGYDYDNYRTSLNSTSLIVNGEMRAEDVNMHLNNYNSRWQFVTFPFDVKVSDIVPQSENTSWVIRGHNGAMRAAGKVDSVWVNLTADDVLEAGKGYIMHNYSPDYNNSWFYVSPLKNSVNRQLIFTSEDRTIELEENLAEFDHNRSWNLIGNPYPCFYDSRFMDFDAPFMIWNSYTQNYMAFNPADDAYILSPGEAFFVQRPYEQESITFRKEGRQTHRYAREMEVYAPARAKGANARVLYNLTLQQDSLADRTRIVFNDVADMGYEMSRDAAKFTSTAKNVPQIFTIDGKSRYAINERPFANGDVALGIYCGAEGEMTITLDKTYDCKVVLEDKLMGTFTELSAENAYTFYATAGEDLKRFVLHFQSEATGINEISSDNMNGEGAIYNLQGVKMNNTKANGIYIKNGQKTVIK